MKRAAKVVGVLVLVSIIGFIVWNDWLRRDPTTPMAEGLTAPGPQTVEEEIVGIGAVLKGDEDTGFARIMSTLPNSPARKAGLSGGWLIQKINDSDTAGLTLRDCVALVRGRAGTKLRLQVWNPETHVTNTVELTRERVVLPAQPMEFE